MNNSLNTHTNHPFIQREQTYVLEKKNLSIHSEDRDYTQFPNSNHFSIDIGEAMTNVESVRLVSYAFPNNCYNISTSYQNTKLAYNYIREYLFDVTHVPVGPPTLSPDNINAGGFTATGGADYQLGVFQNVLENLFPGIIRPFRNSVADPQLPDNAYIPSAQLNTDWVTDGERGMIYTSETFLQSNGNLEPNINFGNLGLPENIDVFYENNNLEWVSIKEYLPFKNTSPPGTLWPAFINGWRKQEPVPENDWTGKFKIVFSIKNKIITIPEGAYSPNNLAATIQNKMNEQIMSYANTLGHQIVGLTLLGNSDVNTFGRMRKPEDSVGNPPKPNGPYYVPNTPFFNNGEIKTFTPIVVKYNNLTNNMLIGSTEGYFDLLANEEIKYSFEKCSPNKLMFSQYTKWGLPFYIGFNKKIYQSLDINIDNDILLNDSSSPNEQPIDICGNDIKNTFISNLNGLILYNDSINPWIVPTGGIIITFYDQSNPGNIPIQYVDSTGMANRTVSILSSPNNVSLMGEDCIYMEMEKYNNINEIYPFSERTNTMYNCDYGHKSDAAFAIIPLTQTPFGNELGNRTSINTNVFLSEPPIKNVNRLEFKFRYHDGRLVDFKNLPFSFVLEFNMLREEQARNKVIRVPHLY